MQMVGLIQGRPNRVNPNRFGYQAESLGYRGGVLDAMVAPQWLGGCWERAPRRRYIPDVPGIRPDIPVGLD